MDIFTSQGEYLGQFPIKLEDELYYIALAPRPRQWKNCEEISQKNVQSNIRDNV